MRHNINLAIQVLLFVAVLFIIQLVGKLVDTAYDIKTAIYGWEEVYDVTE